MNRPLMRGLFLFGILLGPSGAWAQSEEGLTEMEAAIQRAVEKAASFTVAVCVDREQEAAPKEPPREGPMLGPPSMYTGGVFRFRPRAAPTSGTLVGSDGLVLTTYFNVSGKVNDIQVVLPDGQKKAATLLGFHAGADLALLKIEATDVAPLRRSPLNQLKTGLPIVALGRGPDGKGVTVNPGIVSALARLHGRGVQVDARMNYGNVGGPLVDLEGRLVGVTCKVDTKSAGSFGQNSGVSFAITWDQIDKLLPELQRGVKVQGSGAPFMGIQWDQEAQVEDGVAIGQVIPGGSAEAGGIKQGDVILEFGGQRTQNFDELRGVINKRAVGDKVKLKLRRGDEEMELELTLGERPGD